MPETKSRSRGPRATARPAEGTEETKPLTCSVAFCPICAAVTAAQGVAPDAVEHLLNAAREFFLAARAVIDQRADDLAREGERPTTLQRIDIG